jgi:hypothetical protein
MRTAGVGGGVKRAVHPAEEKKRFIQDSNGGLAHVRRAVAGVQLYYHRQDAKGTGHDL